MLLNNAYLLPIFDYCCDIWGKENKSYIYRLYKLEIRICTNFLDLLPDNANLGVFSHKYQAGFVILH
jgi:hypothetical protein